MCIEQSSFNSEIDFQDEESLKIFLEYAYKEYTHCAIERPIIYLNYIKAYITISGLIFSFLFTAITYLEKNNIKLFENFNIYSFELILISASMLSSACVFVYSIDALRGRQKHSFLFNSFNDKISKLNKSDNMLDGVSRKKINQKDVLRSFSEIMMNALNGYNEFDIKIIKKIRSISTYLVISSFLGVMGIILLTLKYNNFFCAYDVSFYISTAILCFIVFFAIRRGFISMFTEELDNN